MKRDLAALSGPHDVLVVGGGIHGAAIAWDAAQRGLRTALVEAADFGAGVSWNSLKTVHGGLRYLQTLDLPRARESVRERRILLQIAPDLVRPLSFVVPTSGHGPKGREAFAAGLLLNELISADRNRGLRPDRRVERARLLSVDALPRLVPGWEPSSRAAVDPESSRAAMGPESSRAAKRRSDPANGAALWHDAQLVSSERLVMAFLTAAAGAGACLANRVEVRSLQREGARVVGAVATDSESGRDLTISARAVIAAAGASFAGVARMAGIARPQVPLLRARNLVLRRRVIGDVAVGARHRGRYLFLVPWRAHTLAGTSYDPPDADPGPAALLADVRAAFPWAGIHAGDVSLVHEGLVPGESGDRLWGQSLVLDHESVDGVPGLISALGVKLTTARAVAEAAVDLAVRRLRAETAPCRTAITPLPARLPDGPVADEARRAVREEMALHLTDAVLRRLDLGTAGPPAAEALETVVSVLRAEHGWDDARVAAERRELDTAYEAARRLPPA